MGLLRWLTGAGSERRRSVRYTSPGLVAYFWEGGAPREHPLKDISLTGAYIFAKDRWLVDTILDITLQAAGEGEHSSGAPFWSVRGKVVRHGPDGFGVDFMWRGDEDRKAIKGLVRSLAQRADALSRRRSGVGSAASRERASDESGSEGSGSQGQALVEYALVVPILLYLIVNTVTLGSFIYSWITIANAARAGAQYAAMGAAYASYPAPAKSSDVQTLIQNETSSLLNAGATNPAVVMCANLNGTAVSYPLPTDGSDPAACPTDVAPPPRDPETITGAGGASTYTTVSIDVTYNVTPIVSALNFPGLNLFMPSLPSSIHRRTVMRVLN